MTLGELRKLLADVPDDAVVMFDATGNISIMSHHAAQVDRVYASYEPLSISGKPWTVVLS